MAAKMFIIFVFHPTLQMTNLRCRTILPSQTLVSQKMPCLVETEYGEKGQRNFQAVTWPLISRDAGQAAALPERNHQCQSKVLFHSVEQEIKIPYLNQERGPTFRVIALWVKHKFCVSPGYIPAGATGRHVTS